MFSSSTRYIHVYSVVATISCTESVKNNHLQIRGGEAILQSILLFVCLLFSPACGSMCLVIVFEVLLAKSYCKLSKSTFTASNHFTIYLFKKLSFGKPTLLVQALVNHIIVVCFSCVSFIQSRQIRFNHLLSMPHLPKSLQCIEVTIYPQQLRINSFIK